MKTAILQVSHRWHAGGTIWPLFHLCSTWGRQRSMRWNARNPLSCLKNHGLFHLGHQKITYPRIRAPQPRCAPVWAFPGLGGTYPARPAEATSERVAGKGKRTVSVILNEVKNPSSPLRANRDGTGSTDPSTPLRSAQDDSEEKRERISPGQKLQNAAQRSGCVLERRSHGAQSKKRRLPQAPGVSEPCGVCFDDAGASRAAGCPPPAARHRAEARTHFS